MAEDFLKRIAQTVLLAGNGLSFGLADKLPGVDRANMDRNIADARHDLGFGGAAVETAGNFAGGAGALKLASKAVLPTLRIAGRVLPAAVRAIKAHPLITGAAATFPALTLANYSSDDYGGGSKQLPAAAPARQAKPKQAPRGTANADKMADGIMGGLDALGAEPPTFQGLAQQLADGQGGNISLRQLMGLSEVAQRTATKPGKAPSAKDVAGMKFLGDVDSTFAGMQAQAQAKLDAGDQTGLDDGRAAVAWRMQQYKQMLGGNPLEDAVAAAMLKAQQAQEDDQ